MNVPYQLHFLLALWSLLTGLLLGFIYEFFRILHHLHPRAKCLLFAEDLLFCLLCTVSLLLLFFNLSFGRMRLYAFVGCAIGFAVWYFTLGKLFRKLLFRLDRLLRPRLQYRRAVLYTARENHRFYRKGRNGFGTMRASSHTKNQEESHHAAQS